jgi:hypothetical protein
VTTTIESDRINCCVAVAEWIGRARLRGEGAVQIEELVLWTMRCGQRKHGVGACWHAGVLVCWCVLARLVCVGVWCLCACVLACLCACVLVCLLVCSLVWLVYGVDVCRRVLVCGAGV